MRPVKRLAEKLTAESVAYGFSLTTWGVGALLIRQFGIPSLLHVLAYVGGAVAGFAALAAIAFSRLFGETEATARPLIVASAIHVIATVGTLLFADLVIRLADPLLPSIAVFALAGICMSAGYNILLTLESVVARLVA